MDVHKNYIGTIVIKWATTGNATSFEIGDQNVDNTVVGEWQTLTWRLPTPAASLETNIDKMVLFVDYTKTNGRTSGPTEYILYIDNIKWNAEKLTDAPQPTCTDGVMNGDEMGIDCGGTCGPCAVPLAVASPAVQHGGTSGTDYISIYSDDLTSIVLDDIDSNLGQSTDANEIVIQGDNILKYDNLNYQGTTFNNNKQDVSGMTHFHLDYYTDNTTAFKFFLN